MLISMVPVCTQITPTAQLHYGKYPLTVSHDLPKSVFSALADPTRRQILESLREQPLSVAEITTRSTVSRPAVSQHLKVLETASLVNVQPVGARRLYSVNQRGLAELRTYLNSYWDDVLGAQACQTASV